MNNDILGQVAVVTGAASGIGRSIALRLAEHGADLLLHTRARQAELASVRENILAMGRRCEMFVADFADAENHQAVVNWACQQSDDIRIWVNNAGADVLTGSKTDFSFEQKLKHLWQVDVAATIHISRAIGERMRTASSGDGDRLIINMGWDQAELGMGGESGEMFSATKGAIMAFSRSLAQSLAPQVRVNCLAPGWIQTAWGKEADEYWQRRATTESLVHRWGQPDDVAEACLFLASSGSFINGQILCVNGGRPFMSSGRKHSIRFPTGRRISRNFLIVLRV